MSNFSSSNELQTMAKRTQDGTGEESVLTSSRATMNLVSKTFAGSTTAQIFECIEHPRTLQASSQNLRLVVSAGRLAAREINQDWPAQGDLSPTIWTSLMSTLNGKTICRSLKPLNHTVRVYSNLRRNMGRKPGDETFKKSGIGQAQYLYSLSERSKFRYLLEEKITRASCRRRAGTVVPRAENFGDMIAADHKVLIDGCESRNSHRYAVVV